MLRFPDYPEIPLANPPIYEVVCQVRFSPLLRIAREEPADLQEAIRARFPGLEILREVQIQAATHGLKPPTLQEGSLLYRFQSEDLRYELTLSPGFFALSTRAYSHWPEFLEHLIFVTRAVERIYQIAHVSRIGLRYINQISQGNSGLPSREALWEMLRPELRAHWRTDVWEHPDECLSQLLITLNQDASERERMTIRAGYVQAHDLCFLDLDCFGEGNLHLDSLQDRCGRYHRWIYQAFRWSISEDKLVSVFGIAGQDGG